MGANHNGTARMCPENVKIKGMNLNLPKLKIFKPTILVNNKIWEGKELVAQLLKV